MDAREKQGKDRDFGKASILAGPDDQWEADRYLPKNNERDTCEIHAPLNVNSACSRRAAQCHGGGECFPIANV